MRLNGRFFSAAAVLIFTCMVLPAIAPAQGTEPTASGEGSPGAGPSPMMKRGYTDPMCLEIGGEFIFDFLLADGNEDASYLGAYNYFASDKMYNFRLGPLLALFVAKGFQIGAIPTFSFTITQDIEDGDNKTTSLYGGLALLFRYIFDLRSIVFPFVGSRMGAYGGEVKSEGSGWFDTSYDITILNIGPHAGIKLVMGKLIVTVFFEYMFNSMKIEDMDDWNEYHTIKFGFELGGWIL